MTNFDDFLKEKMQNARFKEEYEALEPEFTIIQAMIDARIDSGLTQIKLSLF